MTLRETKLIRNAECVSVAVSNIRAKEAALASRRTSETEKA
jgi:hypothetical protein